MALQLPVSNHQWQPHDESSFDRKIGELGGRWRTQR
jgi:L-rhamnose isomerase